MNRLWYDVLRNLFLRGLEGPNRGRVPTAKPELECLEDRVTPAAVLVKDINPLGPPSPSSSPQNLVNVNGTLFFTAFSPGSGHELWKSDGTEAGTVLVKDIRPGSASSYPLALVDVNGTLFFAANDGTHSQELWKSDGTEAGTVMVRDIRPATYVSSYPRSLTNVNGTLFFTATDGTNQAQLWKSNGTEAGTVMVKDIRPGGTYPFGLTNVNGTLFFSAEELINGNELWKSDGTEGGTVLIKDIFPGSYTSHPRNLTDVNGILFFSVDDSVHGQELWKSDGTEAGTVMVKDIRPGNNGSFPQHMANVNGTLFFSAFSGTNQYELWKSDGTEAGTVMVKDIRPGFYGSNPAGLTNFNGTLFFRASDGSPHGPELWKSDGTETGTVMVKDIRPGAFGSYPDELTDVNGTLYFLALTDTHGHELWKSDGTATGTVLVGDINPGNADSNPGSFAVVNGVLFFAAQEGTHGRELWRIDNGAPILDNVGDMRLAPIAEDPVANPGDLVSSVIASAGGNRITDPDGPNAPEGLAVVAADNTRGTWQFSTDGGTNWTDLGSPSQASARLLAADATTRVRFVPSLNFNGTVTDGLTFRAWDQSSGINGGTTSITSTGGITAFSTATETASITVTPVNDAPALDNSGDMRLTAINEDDTTNSGELVSAVIASAGGDRIIDVDPGAVEGVAVVAADNTNGIWQFSIDGGASWANFGSPSEASARLLAANASTRARFVPNLNFNGLIPGGLTFRAWDRSSGTNGGTADVTVNGSTTAFSVAAATASITVNAVNDAPVNLVPAAGQTVPSESPLVFSAANGNGLAVTDLDAGANPLRVTLEAPNGVLTLNGTAGLTFSAGDGSDDGVMTFTGTLADINTALSAVTFRSNPGFSGTTTLRVVTNDLGSTGAGPAQEAHSTLNLTVTPLTTPAPQAPVSPAVPTPGSPAVPELSLKHTKRRKSTVRTLEVFLAEPATVPLTLKLRIPLKGASRRTRFVTGVLTINPGETRREFVFRVVGNPPQEPRRTALIEVNNPFETVFRTIAF